MSSSLLQPPATSSAPPRDLVRTASISAAQPRIFHDRDHEYDYNTNTTYVASQQPNGSGVPRDVSSNRSGQERRYIFVSRGSPSTTCLARSDGQVLTPQRYFYRLDYEYWVNDKPFRFLDRGDVGDEEVFLHPPHDSQRARLYAAPRVCACYRQTPSRGLPAVSEAAPVPDVAKAALRSTQVRDFAVVNDTSRSRPATTAGKRTQIPRIVVHGPAPSRRGGVRDALGRRGRRAEQSVQNFCMHLGQTPRS